MVAFSTIVWAYVTIQKFNEATFVETSVSWELPASVSLQDGPAAFHYDPEHHTLNYRGPLDAEQQLRLRDLLEFDTRPNEGAASATSALTTNAIIRSYHGAIDKLAYQTGGTQVGQIQLLLLLGFMGGILGAILRSLVDFVGHACYTGKLDLTHWWPLYATRPLVGAILGFVLVILLKARLLTSTDIQQGTESFWWLGMAVLGGFSTVDVTQRLRLAAKALFGTTHDKPNA
ncbi:hypothetical protein AWV80_04080 [Cupriavidus sp. UYMU48A]|nr:hypothetical protein AWV80_04080 [Cupriavidus sp. UYMU48A]